MENTQTDKEKATVRQKAPTENPNMKTDTQTKPHKQFIKANHHAPWAVYLVCGGGNLPGVIEALDKGRVTADQLTVALKSGIVGKDIQKGLTDALYSRRAETYKAQADKLAEVARCALADLEGIMPEFEASGDRTHPAWTTIKELKQALAAYEIEVQHV